MLQSNNLFAAGDKPFFRLLLPNSIVVYVFMKIGANFASWKKEL